MSIIITLSVLNCQLELVFLFAKQGIKRGPAALVIDLFPIYTFDN